MFLMVKRIKINIQLLKCILYEFELECMFLEVNVLVGIYNKLYQFVYLIVFFVCILYVGIFLSFGDMVVIK